MTLKKLHGDDARQTLTSIGSVGSVDQHSFLQLMMDGMLDKTVTFIEIEKIWKTEELILKRPLTKLKNWPGIVKSAIVLTIY